jgi:hypothetical protein
MADDAEALALRVQETQPPDSGFRVGVVTSVYPLKVNVQGGVIANVGCASNFTPAIGQSVILVRQDSAWMVLCSSTSGTQPGELITRAETAGGAAAATTVSEVTAITCPQALWPGNTVFEIRVNAYMFAVTNVCGSLLIVRSVEKGNATVLTWQRHNVVVGYAQAQYLVGYVINSTDQVLSRTITFSYTAQLANSTQMSGTSAGSSNWIEARIAPGPIERYPLALQI